MATGTCKLWVAIADASALIKVCGRATFVCSADFKSLVYQLRDRQCRQFILDLTECLIIDSTFLGILARFGLKLSQEEEGAGKVTILNANERIVHLLENLGVAHLFEMVQGAEPLRAEGASDIAVTTKADKPELTRTSLEAHQTLAELSASNAVRFKDVIRFLAEDLKNQEPPVPPPVKDPRRGPEPH